MKRRQFYYFIIRLFCYSFLFLLFLNHKSYFINQVYALTEKTYYIHQDHLGSVIAVTDETGTLVSQTKYSPYGSQLPTTNYKLPTERTYTGQIKDQNTTLSYYNARYYDPVLSRFISPDSVNDQQNRFAYVGGNPVMRNDPSGNNIIDDLKKTFTDFVKTQKAEAEQILDLNNGTPAERLAVATDLITMGGFRNATFAYNEYAAWSADYNSQLAESKGGKPVSIVDYADEYATRLEHAFAPGVAITGFSASLVGVGQTSVAGIRAVDKIATKGIQQYGEKILNDYGLKELSAMDDPNMAYDVINSRFAQTEAKMSFVPRDTFDQMGMYNSYNPSGKILTTSGSEEKIGGATLRFFNIKPVLHELVHYVDRTERGLSGIFSSAITEGHAYPVSAYLENWSFEKTLSGYLGSVFSK